MTEKIIILANQVTMLSEEIQCIASKMRWMEENNCSTEELYSMEQTLKERVEELATISASYLND